MIISITIILLELFVTFSCVIILYWFSSANMPYENMNALINVKILFVSECIPVTIDFYNAHKYIDIVLYRNDIEEENLNYLLQSGQPLTVDDQLELVIKFASRVFRIVLFEFSVRDIKQLQYTIEPGEKTYIKVTSVDFFNQLTLGHTLYFILP